MTPPTAKDIKTPKKSSNLIERYLFGFANSVRLIGKLGRPTTQYPTGECSSRVTTDASSGTVDT